VSDAARKVRTDAQSERRLNRVRAAELLRDLRRAHDELTAGLCELDQLTAQRQADIARYPHARWRLSCARRACRAATTEIYPGIVQIAVPDEAAAIERLREGDARGLGASALHVHHWTLARIDADWAGYCAASMPLRASARTRMAAERSLLYPLLERVARGD
jgi:hypothetical protein